MELWKNSRPGGPLSLCFFLSSNLQSCPHFVDGIVVFLKLEKHTSTVLCKQMSRVVIDHILYNNGNNTKILEAGKCQKNGYYTEQ